jgi:hypothetical protein
MLTNYPLASNIFSAKRQHTEVRATAVIASPEIACNMRKIAQFGDLQLRLGRAEPVLLTSWLAGRGAGGQTFTVSSQCSAVGPRPEVVHNAALAVIPNAEGDVWLADGHSVFHSTDGGAGWAWLRVTASIRARPPLPWSSRA